MLQIVLLNPSLWLCNKWLKLQNVFVSEYECSLVSVSILISPSICISYIIYIQCSEPIPYGKIGFYQKVIILINYITERSVRWYYGFSIAASAAAARRPWRREHSNSKNIQPISFKFYIWVDTPLRYFAIEIWCPPRTRTTAFAAKRHSYPQIFKMQYLDN